MTERGFQEKDTSWGLGGLGAFKIEVCRARRNVFQNLTLHHSPERFYFLFQRTRLSEINVQIFEIVPSSSSLPLKMALILVLRSYMYNTIKFLNNSDGQCVEPSCIDTV